MKQAKSGKVDSAGKQPITEFAAANTDSRITEISSHEIRPDDENASVWMNPRRLLMNANSLLVSSVLHLVILILLGLFTLVDEIQSVFVLDSSMVENEIVQLQEFEIETSEPVVELATSDPPTVIFDPLSSFDSVDAEIDLGSEIAIVEEPQAGLFENVLTNSDELLSEIESHLDGAIGQPGPRLREANSEKEAVDGIAAEILKQRRAGDLLTVWLFDASISLRENRIKAAKRLGEVFAEIDERLEGSTHESQNAVVAFGNGCATLVPPTSSTRNVTRAIRNIPEDPTGKENVFSSVVWSVNQFREQWNEKMMVVIWTDESGDDLRQLESTIAFCKKNEVTVSVVGPTAVLGFEMGTQLFHHKASRKNFYLPVKRGPETALKQRVFMPRWRNVGWNKDEWLTEPISSGFAPFSLMRLSRETGGSFTIFDRIGDRGPFRLDAISGYVPDYHNTSQLEDELGDFPLRKAVVAAVRETYKQPNRAAPRMTFFPLWMAPAAFHRQLPPVLEGEATFAANMATLADRALKHLVADGVEEAYAQETPRWRASYDLARGRLLRMSVRYREYVEACRAIRLKDTTNLLSFRPTSKLKTDDGRQRAEEADRFLNRCIKDHPDTPWSLLAHTELRHPLGFTDSQRNQPQPNRSSGGRTGAAISLPNL